MPDENIYDISQSDGSLNENLTGSTFNNEAAVVQGPQEMMTKTNCGKHG